MIGFPLQMGRRWKPAGDLLRILCLGTVPFLRKKFFCFCISKDREEKKVYITPASSYLPIDLLLSSSASQSSFTYTHKHTHTQTSTTTTKTKQNKHHQNVLGRARLHRPLRRRQVPLLQRPLLPPRLNRRPIRRCLCRQLAQRLARPQQHQRRQQEGEEELHHQGL